MSAVPRLSGPGLRLTALALGQFVVAVDFDIVFVALPHIGRALGFGPAELQWVVSAYTVVLGGFLLLGGRAADRLGARRMFVVGVVLFGLASAAGGAAPTPVTLVAARAVQGLGAAAMVPAGLALISASFPEGEERGRAFAAWGVAGASGAAVGALGGGVLTAALGWRAVLLVNVPVTVFLAVAARAFDADGAPRAGSFDLPGAVLVTTATSALVLGVVTGNGWVGAGGVVGLAVLVVVEARTTDPLFPLALLGPALLVPAGAVFLLMGAIGATYYATTVFLQDALGLAPLVAGLAFLPLSLLSMIGSGVAFPRSSIRFGVRRTLTIGLAGTAVALVGLAGGLTGGSYAATLPWLTWALFAGIAFPAVFRAAALAAPADRQGVAAAAVSTAQYLGAAVGLAVILGVGGLDRAVRGDLTGALGVTALLAAAAAALAAGWTVVVRPRPHRSNGSTPSPNW